MHPSKTKYLTNVMWGLYLKHRCVSITRIWTHIRNSWIWKEKKKKKSCWLWLILTMSLEISLTFWASCFVFLYWNPSYVPCGIGHFLSQKFQGTMGRNFHILIFEMLISYHLLLNNVHMEELRKWSKF